MFREFHAVGQGAFYSETFEVYGGRINIVYDCGTATGIKYVKREIKSVFEENETIHALFISHLHEDHINGIPYLIEYCNVKRIFFPLVTEESKLLLKVRLSIEEKYGFTYKFIDNPKQAISEILNEKGIENKEPKLIGIIEGEEEQVNKENDTVIYDKIIPSGKNVLSEILSDSEIVSDLEDINWIYIPYNFKQEERIGILKKALKDKEISIDELTELGQIDKEHDKKIKDIKEVYKNTIEGFNSNSMTLFSGIYNCGVQKKPYYRQRYMYCNSYPYCRECWNFRLKRGIGCLYTGDYDASKEQMFSELKSKYSKYWPSIGCIQIPHHGSRHNHNIKMVEQGLCYIISAGYKNKYNHPDSRVIKDILLEGGLPFIVTEKTSSRVFFCVHFY